MEKKGDIKDFSMAEGGYGLCLFDMKRYCGRVFPEGIFKYGQQFEIKKGDMITMELDLTKSKGILKFTFNADLKDPKSEKTLSIF